MTILDYGQALAPRRRSLEYPQAVKDARAYVHDPLSGPCRRDGVRPLAAFSSTVRDALTKVVRSSIFPSA